MKVRKREKIFPIHLYPEDTISLIYKEVSDLTGELISETTVLKSEIDKKITITEAVVFDVEEGDFGAEVVDGIGGAFLQIKKKSG